MTLTPYSNGEDNAPLMEFNPCHDPKSGRFAGRSAGRCSDSVKDERHTVASAIRRDSKLSDGMRDAWRDWARERRAARRAALKGEGPAALRDDIKRALKDERVTVIQTNDPFYDVRGSSSANAAKKQVTLKLTDANEKSLAGVAGKRALLTILRHEVGHVMPDDFARTAKVVGLSPKDLILDATTWHLEGQDFSRIVDRVKKPKEFYDAQVQSQAANQVQGLLDKAFGTGTYFANDFLEETRAWRNAIKFGRGRIDFNVAQRALGSYGKHAFGPKVGPLHTERALAHLRRYARIVRRARKRAA